MKCVDGLCRCPYFQVSTLTGSTAQTVYQHIVIHDIVDLHWNNTDSCPTGRHHSLNPYVGYACR